jgi:hypothetical protein
MNIFIVIGFLVAMAVVIGICVWELSKAKKKGK